VQNEANFAHFIQRLAKSGLRGGDHTKAHIFAYISKVPAGAGSRAENVERGLACREQVVRNDASMAIANQTASAHLIA
jgi:hypothetical protein